MYAETIEKLIRAGIEVEEVKVIDESMDHAGHSGAASGGGHFHLLVVSSVFGGKSLVERHRQIYDLLSMGKNPEIHALAITALTPEEFKLRR